MPIVFQLTGPETGHRLAVKAAHYGLMPRVRTVTHPELVLVVLLITRINRKNHNQQEFSYGSIMPCFVVPLLFCAYSCNITLHSNFLQFILIWKFNCAEH